METLTPHLAQIKKESEVWSDRTESARPTLTPEDGPLLFTYVTRYRAHYFTPNVVIKREPHKDESGLDIHGDQIAVPYIAERIRIEAANLQFIAQHTTIPVPQFLGVWQENGLWHLKTALVHGAVELGNLDEDKKPAAVAAVEAQLQADVLPQLRRLRRHFMGCSDPARAVVPPHRLWGQKTNHTWSSMPVEPERGDGGGPYVFCHTDLGRQNIMVDPETYRIVSIIDWETAGFWPEAWELPYWKANGRLERSAMTDKVREAERAAITATEAEERVEEKKTKPTTTAEKSNREA